mmetsp:Transcript_27219/g.54821  ORF Transcript_27219/g.54821 Transcript_27219/m.54821 type:complete len:539 (+) Transcript_27219:148-1764(+)
MSQKGAHLLFRTLSLFNIASCFLIRAHRRPPRISISASLLSKEDQNPGFDGSNGTDHLAILSFDFVLHDGAVERVAMNDESDAEECAQKIMARNPQAESDQASTAATLRARWQSVVPRVYDGPTPFQSKQRTHGVHYDDWLEESLTSAMESQKPGAKRVPPDSPAGGGRGWKPSPQEIAWRTRVVASVNVGQTGLVLEVAPSTVAGAGLGLFVRKLGGGDDVTVFPGDPLCGFARHGIYAAAPPPTPVPPASLSSSSSSSSCFLNSPSGGSGRWASVRLGLLRSLDTEVEFDGSLMPLRQAMAKANTYQVVGHTTEMDETSDGGSSRYPASIQPDPDSRGRVNFFVPDDTGLPRGGASGPVPRPLGILDAGQMANDLAVSTAAATTTTPSSNGHDSSPATSVELSSYCRLAPPWDTYENASRENNVLCITPRMRLVEMLPRSNRANDEPQDVKPEENERKLVVLSPLLTLRRAVTFDSEEPMELGLPYGESHWRNFPSPRSTFITGNTDDTYAATRKEPTEDGPQFGDGDGRIFFSSR